MKKVTVLIPCYNEEKGISKVIKSIPVEKLNLLGYHCEIIVIDNNSTDRTAEIACECGAQVIHEPHRGKGNAVMTGFRSLDKNTSIVVMIDGDNSYDSGEMLRLIEPIDSGFCDVVVGTRLNGKMSKESMTYFNRIGNWLFTFLVRTSLRANITDVCSGFFAWRKEMIDMLLPYIKSNGFTFEMEMITLSAKMKFDMYSMPITYVEREGKSHLDPVVDGIKILSTFFSLYFWNPKNYTKVKRADPLEELA